MGPTLRSVIVVPCNDVLHVRGLTQPRFVDSKSDEWVLLLGVLLLSLVMMCSM